ncbi:hypothetical protein SUT380_21070 (plasmid) [Streptococcus parasuis]|nr:hypothetical protein SUT380_21070 [Streptococcus parasuis]
MNKFKNIANNNVCIRDLKQLGREGGAIAYLESGDIMVLKPKYGTISKKGYCSGQVVNVEVKYEYNKIFCEIRSIERNGILIARRCRFGIYKILKLTGYGFHRKWKGGSV